MGVGWATLVLVSHSLPPPISPKLTVSVSSTTPPCQWFRSILILLPVLGELWMLSLDQDCWSHLGAT